MPDSLDAWLARIEQAHPANIALGLDRVNIVLPRLARPQRVPLIVVGGTNGKGSTCALLEAMLHAAGYRVGLYTSPHIERYNERVRIGCVEATDDALVASFEAVERARADVPLTYFEFGTLAAWEVFAAADCDAIVMEVGLGGRLDAVNAFDADCAVVTSVALDHMDWLGNTRESIGWEKAHIFRAGRPALCADPAPPVTLVDHAQSVGADLLRFGIDYGLDWDPEQPQQWSVWNRQGRRHGLGHPALRGRLQLRNAATAITALDSLPDRLPVTAGAIRLGLATAELPARFQVLPGQPAIILDVGHNPEAAQVLAQNLADMVMPGTSAPHTIGVYAMLRDKDITGVAAALAGSINEWFVAGLPGMRGTTSADIELAIRAAGVRTPVFPCASVAGALAAAREAAKPDDRIVVFGSFVTVAQALAALGR